MRHGIHFIFFAAFVCFSTASLAQFTPVPLTGYNQDAVAEAGPSSQATTTLQMDGGASNKVMYTNAFRTFAALGGGGLPDNGTIVSGGDTYQLESYTANNALYIFRNETRSLNLVTPASYARLRVLALSTEGASTVSISVGFTDGSSTVYAPASSIPDWFNGATNVVLQGFGRVTRSAAGPFTADAYPTNPRMYFIELTMNCTDRPKLVQSITVTNNSTFPNNAPFPNTVILGMSAIGYSQTVTPTIVPCDCSGPNGSITLNVTGSTSPYTYSWNTTPVQTGPTATGLAPGTYTCTITDAGGCPSTYTGTVTLNNNAVVTAAANPATICAGGSSSLTATATVGNLTSYTWNPGAITGNPVNVSPGSTTTYTVTGTNTLGCSANATVTVNVNPLPTAPVAPDVAVCPGNNAVLQVTSPVAGSTYNWYTTTTGGTPVATGTSYTVLNVVAAQTFYVEVTSATNCTSATRTPVNITLNTVPAAPVVNNIAVCAGTDGTLTIQSPQPGYTYNWYSTATGGTPAGTGTSFTQPAVAAATTWYAEAVNATGCISATRTAADITLLTQLAAPVVTVSNVTFTSITFSWSAVAGATSYEVSTNGGAIWSPPSSGANGTTHTVSGLAGNTTVNIQVRALRNQPCETSVAGLATGTTLSSKEIFVPNVFTPNGDGRNDVLFVYGNYVASIKLHIFNQWGQLIFVSENISTGWDGKYKGQPQPVGVYAYTLKVVLQDGTIITKKGAINLIR